MFQAGDYEKADTVLSQAAADPAAGPLQAKAAMLRCLAQAAPSTRACLELRAELTRRPLKSSFAIFRTTPRPTKLAGFWAGLLSPRANASGPTRSGRPLPRPLRPGSTRELPSRALIVMSLIASKSIPIAAS